MPISIYEMGTRRPVSIGVHDSDPIWCIHALEYNTGKFVNVALMQNAALADEQVSKRQPPSIHNPPPIEPPEPAARE